MLRPTPRSTRRNPSRTLAERINAEGPRHLAAAARECGAAADPHLHRLCVRRRGIRPYRPDAATNPLSVYGRTKRDGEHAVLETLPERCGRARTAWVYAAPRPQLRAHDAAAHARARRGTGGGRSGGHADRGRFVAEALWRLARASGRSRHPPLDRRGSRELVRLCAGDRRGGRQAGAAHGRRRSRRSPLRTTRRRPAAPPTACST